MSEEKPAEVKLCPYCRKPIETPVSSKIFRRGRDPRTGKQACITEWMTFCSGACASYMQMSMEG